MRQNISLVLALLGGCMPQPPGQEEVLAGLREDLDALREELDQTKADVVTLETRVVQLETENGDLHEELAALSSDVNVSAQAVATIEVRVEGVEATVHDITTPATCVCDTSVLEARVTDIETYLDGGDTTLFDGGHVTTVEVQGYVADALADCVTSDDLLEYATTQEVAACATDEELVALGEQVAQLETDVGMADGVSLGEVEDYVERVLADYVTDDDLLGYATTQEVDACATDAELVALGEQVAQLETDVAACATDAELANYATEADLGGYVKLITANQTWTIPQQYANLHVALAELGKYQIAPDAMVTLRLSGTQPRYRDTIRFQHPNGDRVQIIGNESNPASVVIECEVDGPCLEVIDGAVLSKLAGLTIRHFALNANPVIKVAGNAYLGGNDITIDEGLGDGIEVLSGGTLVMSDGLSIDVGGYDLNLKYGATAWAPNSEFSSDGVRSDSGSNAAIDVSHLSGTLAAYSSSSIVCINCVDVGLTSMYSRDGSSVVSPIIASISTAGVSDTSSLYALGTIVSSEPEVDFNSSGIFAIGGGPLYPNCDDDSFCSWQ